MYALYCFNLNFKEGKTELSLHLRGAGAKWVAGDLARCGNVVRANMIKGDIRVNIANVYKHRGTQCHAFRGVSYDIADTVRVSNASKHTYSHIFTSSMCRPIVNHMYLERMCHPKGSLMLGPGAACPII